MSLAFFFWCKGKERLFFYILTYFAGFLIWKDWGIFYVAGAGEMEEEEEDWLLLW